MLSFRHLVIFKTVTETGNFTKAAQALFITQSAVSHAILELETQAGTSLFDRHAKGVDLTPAGRLLLEETLPILSAISALEKRLDRLNEQAPVSIVSSITIAAFWLPRILKDFESKWPQIPVSVEVVRAAEAIKRLQAGRADIALLEGEHPRGRFCCRVFDHHPLLPVCAPDYGLLGRQINVEEFCSQRLLLREKGSAIRDALDSRLFLLGRTVYPIWTSVNSTALIEAAKAGLGITVLPEILVRGELHKKNLVMVDVADFTLGNELLVAWHKDKNLTPPIEELIAMFRDFNKITGK